MEFTDRLFEMLASVIDVLFVYSVVSIILGRKSANKNRCVLITVCIAFAILVISYFTCNTQLQSIFLCTVMFVYSVIFLRGRTYSKILVNLVVFMALIVLDFLNALVFSTISDLTVSELLTPGTSVRDFSLLTSKFCLIPVALVIIKAFSKNKSIDRGMPFSVVFFVGCYIIALIIRGTNYRNSNGTADSAYDIENLAILTILLVFCILNAVYTFYLNFNYINKREFEMLYKGIADQKNLLEKMDDIYTEARIMRHDMKHYITLLTSLINDNKIDEAKKTLQEMSEQKVFAPVIKYSASEVINAILNEKQNECDKNNIRFEFKISGSVSRKYELDISIILANLLDNAIEYEKSIAKKSIILKMHEHKGMYYISVYNRIEHSVLEANPTFETTKEDKSLHGVGIRSIKRHVEKLDGCYQYLEENGYFLTYITLPNP